jgi:Helix-turn-helix domain
MALLEEEKGPVPTTPVNDDIVAPRMFTRGDAMRILRIGETTLHFLTKTGKLQSVRIGARVLIPAAEIERLCRKGATLTGPRRQPLRGRKATPRLQATPSSTAMVTKFVKCSDALAALRSNSLPTKR